MVRTELEELEAALDNFERARREDPSSFSDRESMVALHRLNSRFEYELTQCVASFDSSRVYAIDGAKSAAAWISRRCRIQKSEAARRVKLGRGLKELPETEAAFSRGEIASSHASSITRLNRPGTAEPLARDEKLLVDYAKDLRPADFEKALGYWEQMADEDGSFAAYEAKVARRDAYFVKSHGEMWVGRQLLDPISGTQVRAELDRLYSKLYLSDVEDAKSGLGRDVVESDLSRTPSQRRADALVEMAVRSRSSCDAATRPAPNVVVLVDYPTLTRVCELDDGTVLPPEALGGLLPAAYLERAVFGPANRIEVGPAARFFTGVTRRAIEIRDRRCTNEFCDVHGKWCQADHVIPYSEGGPTTQENGRLLCGFHNRLRNNKDAPPEPSERAGPLTGSEAPSDTQAEQESDAELTDPDP